MLQSKMYYFKLLTAFIVSFICIKLLIKYSSSLGLVDIPNERSSHSEHTPRGAGIGFGFAFFLSILLFDFTLLLKNWFVFLAILLVFLIGILDDHKDSTPKQKIYVILLSSLILYFNDIYIGNLGLFFGYEIPLGYISFPLTLVFLIGFTNALNLIDGLDGLSSSITVVILSTFLYIGYVNQDEVIISICLVTIASLCAFLFFNWNPASIFMGDSGSLFLGFTIATVALLSIQYIHPIIVLYILMIPIVDTFVVMIRRIKRKKSIFNADKTHIHHILLKFFGKRVKKTVFFLVLTQILFSWGGLMLALSSKEIGEGIGSTVLLFLFIGIIILSYMILTGMKRRQKLIEKLANRRKRSPKLR